MKQFWLYLINNYCSWSMKYPFPCLHKYQTRFVFMWELLCSNVLGWMVEWRAHGRAEELAGTHEGAFTYSVIAGKMKKSHLVYKVNGHVKLVCLYDGWRTCRKNNLMNCHWPVFPLSSSFHSPSSFLSDHSDPLKIFSILINCQLPAAACLVTEIVDW